MICIGEISTMRQRGWIGSTPEPHHLAFSILGRARSAPASRRSIRGHACRRTGARPALRVIGAGHQKSRGVKGGVITGSRRSGAGNAGRYRRRPSAWPGHARQRACVRDLRPPSNRIISPPTTDVESGVVGDDDIRHVCLQPARPTPNAKDGCFSHLNEVGLRRRWDPRARSAQAWLRARAAPACQLPSRGRGAAAQSACSSSRRCYLSAAARPGALRQRAGRDDSCYIFFFFFFFFFFFPEPPSRRRRGRHRQGGTTDACRCSPKKPRFSLCRQRAGRQSRHIRHCARVHTPARRLERIKAL